MKRIEPGMPCRVAVADKVIGPQVNGMVVIPTAKARRPGGYWYISPRLEITLDRAVADSEGNTIVAGTHAIKAMHEKHLVPLDRPREDDVDQMVLRAGRPGALKLDEVPLQ
jgi:hypothetical protein